MTPLLVLVHSPSVGPGTWQPVARHLRSLGVESVVPDLRSIGHGGPPYWPRVAASVAEQIGKSASQIEHDGESAHQGERERPLVLVAHSNAGLFLPTIHNASPRPVAGAVFVDAGLPATDGETPVAPAQFLARLRGLADEDGILPRWTDWWTDEDVAELLPDPAVRAIIVAEQPRLPLAYYLQTLPVPASWVTTPAAYLQFCDGYADEAERARRAGWSVEHIPGEHLHQVVDPVPVANRILAMATDIVNKSRHQTSSTG